MSVDLAIAYRVYPGVSKQPVIHADDKLKLTELGLRSLVTALGDLRVRFFAILDGCPPDYDTLLQRTIGSAPRCELHLLHCDAVGNAATFSRQLELLCAADDVELVYLAEDDYFYLPDALKTMVEFMRAHPDADFASGYDHPDYRTLDLHAVKEQQRSSAGRTWSTRGTTCLTFMARRRSLIEARRVFETFGRKNYDTSIWLALTKRRVYQPLRILLSAVTNIWVFKIYCKTWLYCLPQLLWGKRFSLWVPTSSLATHLEQTGLAPGVDWQRAFEKH